MTDERLAAAALVPPAPSGPSAALARRERDALAVDYRAAGDSFPTIAEKMGSSPASARAAVVRGLAATKRAIVEDADGIRALEAERLDAVAAALWPAATSGQDLRAAEAYVKTRESYRKLVGVDLRVDTAPAGPVIIIASADPTPRPSDPMPSPVFEHEADVVDDDVLQLGPGEGPE